MKHFHKWKPKKRAFEFAIGCSCGIAMMAYFDRPLAQQTAKLSNEKENVRKWKWIKGES